MKALKTDFETSPRINLYNLINSTIIYLAGWQRKFEIAIETAENIAKGIIEAAKDYQDNTDVIDEFDSIITFSKNRSEVKAHLDSLIESKVKKFNKILGLADGQQRNTVVMIFINELKKILESLNISTELRVPVFIFEKEKVQKDYIAYLKGSKNKNNKFYTIGKSYHNLLAKESSQTLQGIEEFVKVGLIVDNKKCSTEDIASREFIQVNADQKKAKLQTILHSIFYINLENLNNSLPKKQRIPVHAFPKEEDGLFPMLDAYYTLLKDVSESSRFNDEAYISFLRERVISTKRDFEDFHNFALAYNYLTSQPIWSSIKTLDNKGFEKLVIIKNWFLTKSLQEDVDNFDPTVYTLSEDADFKKNLLTALVMASSVFKAKGLDPSTSPRKLQYSLINKAKTGSNWVDLGKTCEEFARNEDNNLQISFKQFKDFSRTIGKKRSKGIYYTDLSINNLSQVIPWDSMHADHNIIPDKPNADFLLHSPWSETDRDKIKDSLANYRYTLSKTNEKNSNKVGEVRAANINNELQNNAYLSTGINGIWDQKKVKKLQADYPEERLQKLLDRMYDTWPYFKAFIPSKK